MKALEDASCFVVVRNSTTDIYCRIWCVCELMYAKKFGLVPDKTHVVGPDSFSQSNSSCLDATAWNPDDKEKILRVLLSEHTRQTMDEFVCRFRRHETLHSLEVDISGDSTQSLQETLNTSRVQLFCRLLGQRIYSHRRGIVLFFISVVGILVAAFHLPWKAYGE